MISRPLRALGVLLAVLLVGAATVAAAPAPGGSVRSEDLRIDVLDGPARDQPQTPRRHPLAAGDPRSRRPRCCVAHGFGGSKDSVAEEARAWAERGYVALAWSARGFGESTGQIALNSPEYEVADARQLVDWLAARPEVRQDGPGDPRVGRHRRLVRRGAVAAARRRGPAASTRRSRSSPGTTSGSRSSPTEPAPTPPPTPAASAAAPDGVFKRAWSALFFGSGSRPAPGQEQAPPQVCGRFVPEVCAGYVAAVTTGREPAELASFFDRASPAERGRAASPRRRCWSRASRTRCSGSTRPTPPPARSPRAAGTVAVSWFAGGHDGGEPDQRTTDRMQAWFDHHLAGTGADPGAAFTYVVPSGVQARRAPTQRTITASVYPGLDGGPGDRPHAAAAARRGPGRRRAGRRAPRPRSRRCPGLAGLAGGAAGGGGSGDDEEDDGGGSSGGGGGGGGAGGGGGGASALLGRLANDLPGQAARVLHRPAARPHGRRRHAGGPAHGVVGARAPVAGEPVLFAKVYDVAAGDGAPGTRTLLGNAVSPMRLPADGTDADRGVGEPPRRGGDARRRPPPRGRRLDHRPGLRRRDRPGGAPDRPGR